MKCDCTAAQQRWLTLLFDHGFLEAKDWTHWLEFDEIPKNQNLCEIFKLTPAGVFLMQLRGPPREGHQDPAHQVWAVMAPAFTLLSWSSCGFLTAKSVYFEIFKN